MKKRTVSLLLAVWMLLSLVSCGSGQGIVMQYGPAQITEPMYRYWKTTFKEYILSSFSGAEDTAAFWNSEAAGGMNMQDYMEEIITGNIKKNLVCMKLFDDYKLKISAEDAAGIEADIADLIDSYGSKAALNASLADYGINADILRDIYTIQAEISAVSEYLESEGIVVPSDEQLEAYYLANYGRILYLTFRLYRVDTDENGKSTYAALTEEERADKEALIRAAMAEIDAGADFSEVMTKYSEESLEGYENGVYISNANAGYEIIARALAMEVGEVERVDQTNVVYIVKRLELEHKPYLNDTMGQFTDLAANCMDEVLQNYLTGFFGGIRVNEALCAKYPLSGLYAG